MPHHPYLIMDESVNPDSVLPRLFFQGIELPRGAYFFDCVLDNKLPEEYDTSENEADWWWRFPICVGRERRAASDDVIRYLVRMRKHLIALDSVIRKRFDYLPNACSEILISELKDSVEIMYEESKKTRTCCWIGKCDNSISPPFNPTAFLSIISKYQAMQKAVHELLNVLSYDGLDQFIDKCDILHISANDVREILKSYGQQLAPPPENWTESFDATQIDGSSWRARILLWTFEETRSRPLLTLLVSIDHGTTKVELCHLCIVDN
jgi:hypothetical protein